MQQGPATGAQQYAYYVVDEVLNYGGFFGGTTVTLYAHPPAEPNADRQFIIAEHNFENLKDGDRFKVQEGQMLGLVLDGDEVRAARIVGAPTREALRAAVAPPVPAPGQELAPRSLAYHCSQCNLWIAEQPVRESPAGAYLCAICGQVLR